MPQNMPQNTSRNTDPERTLLENEDADPVGHSPPQPADLEHVEQAAERVEQPAKEPADRTAELMHQELELTDAGIASPDDSPPPSR